MHEKTVKVTQSAVQKTYRLYAPIYDRVFGAVLEPGRRELCKEVNLIKPQSILEIGVGTGLLLDKYPAYSKITGIDISHEMLDIARQRAKELSHMTITLEEMDAEHLTFPNGHFDCVVLPYVLSVTPNPAALIGEARRVCKKDGVIIIVNHFSGSGVWYVLEKMVSSLAARIGFRSEFSYEKNVLNIDWTVENVKAVNLFGLSKLIVIRNSSPVEQVRSLAQADVV